MTKEEFQHSEDSIKSGDRLIAFLKAEVDKQVARGRLFESRSQIMATFAGTAGTLTALLKPPSLSLLSVILLALTALLTLAVIFLAFTTHINRDIGVVDIDNWENVKNKIWEEDIAAMAVSHQIQDSYIDDFKDNYAVANLKGEIVSNIQKVLSVQLVFVVLTILSFVIPGVLNESKATATAPAAATKSPAIQHQPNTQTTKTIPSDH